MRLPNFNSFFLLETLARFFLTQFPTTLRYFQEIYSLNLSNHAVKLNLKNISWDIANEISLLFGWASVFRMFAR